MPIWLRSVCTNEIKDSGIDLSTQIGVDELIEGDFSCGGISLQRSSLVFALSFSAHLGAPLFLLLSLSLELFLALEVVLLLCRFFQSLLLALAAAFAAALAATSFFEHTSGRSRFSRVGVLQVIHVLLLHSRLVIVGGGRLPKKVAGSLEVHDHGSIHAGPDGASNRVVGCLHGHLLSGLVIHFLHVWVGGPLVDPVALCNRVLGYVDSPAGLETNLRLFVKRLR